MKNEVLMKAIGEIDDDLIEEARLPYPKKHRAFGVVSRCAAAAACLVLVAVGVLFLWQRTPEVALSIDGKQVFSESSEVGTVLTLEPSLQARSVKRTEIPLHISTQGKAVSLSAYEGGYLSDENGREEKSLVVSEDADIKWLVDITLQSSFELTVNWDDASLRLTAVVSEDSSSVTVTVSKSSKS